MNHNYTNFSAQYMAFGLKISSCLPLPFNSVVFDQPDVVIKADDIAFDEADYHDSGVLKKHPQGAEYLEVQVNDFQTLFFAYELGDMLVQNGNEIVLDLNNAPSQKDWLNLFIMSAAIPIILLQRGSFALHASCIQIGEKAVAFAGDSGMGKSTMVASLLSKSGRLVSDDITMIDFDEEGRAFVFPEYRQLRLHEESAMAVDLQHAGERNEWADSKQLVSIEQSMTEKVFLDKIYFLEWGDDQKAQLIPENKTEAFNKIYKLVYRLSQMSHERRIGNFKWLSRVIESTPMMRLVRPKDLNQVHEVADLVTKELTEL